MVQRAAIGLLLSVAGLSVLNAYVNAGAASGPGLLWSGFLLGLPLLLTVLLALRMRWVYMATVMYGTIGLALDISTIIHALVQGDTGRSILFSSLTGVLNALLAVVGWQGFIGGDPLARPPGGRPPSPPSPPSA